MSNTSDVTVILNNGIPTYVNDVTYQILPEQKLVLIETKSGTIWLNWDNVASFGASPHVESDE